MHEFVLGDLSAGDERGEKITARHRVSLPRDAQHHSVSRVWERLVLRHMSPNRREVLAVAVPPRPLPWPRR